MVIRDRSENRGLVYRRRSLLDFVIIEMLAGCVFVWYGVHDRIWQLKVLRERERMIVDLRLSDE